jgi:hypothetical protein
MVYTVDTHFGVSIMVSNAVLYIEPWVYSYIMFDIMNRISKRISHGTDTE